MYIEPVTDKYNPPRESNKIYIHNPYDDRSLMDEPDPRVWELYFDITSDTGTKPLILDNPYYGTAFQVYDYILLDETTDIKKHAFKYGIEFTQHRNSRGVALKTLKVSILKMIFPYPRVRTMMYYFTERSARFLPCTTKDFELLEKTIPERYYPYLV